MKAYGFVILSLFIILSACAPAPEKVPSIKIGAALPLTGTASPYGQNARQGIDLAVKEINAAGGVSGRPIQIIYEDDATDPTKSLTAVTKLIEVDEVQVIIGGMWDFLANAVIPEIDRRKVILISPAALPDIITQTSPYFFAFHPPVASNQQIFEKWLKQLPGKRVGAFVINNPWGLVHLETFKKAVDATGGTLVEARILPNFDTNDISTELTRFKGLELDGLFATINFNDMVLLGRKRGELRFTSQILAHENFAGSIRAGRMPIEHGEGVTIFRFAEPSEEFIAKFTQEYNKPPEFTADTAYDIIYALKKAIENSGDNAEQIRQGLHTINFTGASGPIYLGEHSYPMNKQPTLERIRSGKFTPLD